MSICPINNNIKYKSSFTPPTDSNKKIKDDKLQLGNASKRSRKKPLVEGRKGSIEVKKGTLPERGTSEKQILPEYVTNKLEKRSKRTSREADYRRKLGCEQINSKKASLNHLLNFKFEPRGGGVEQWRTSAPSTRPKKYQQHEIFSSEKFLQANCQFLVKDDGEYEVHYVDPDLPVKWERILQVNIWTDEPLSCPICLYPPFVAQITKCGHVYCWPCMLHYLALGEKNVQKCPLCHDVVHEKDLRSVLVHEDDKSKVGEEITMTLMSCLRSNALPHPVRCGEVKSLPNISFDTKRNVKIIKMSALEELDKIVRPELELLKLKIMLNESDPVEIMFLEAAIKLSEKREAALLSKISDECCHENLVPCDITSVGTPDESNNERSNENDKYDAMTVQKKQSLKQDEPFDNLYYFYQCEDGRHIYTHGINIKCLLKEYGDFTKFPKDIKGRIVELESFTMTQALRKRHRYLSHLPLSCEFKVVELDLLDPLLTKETLDEFQDQIERRVKIRLRKEREENRFNHQAEVNERRKFEKLSMLEPGNSRYSVMNTQLSNASAGGSISVLIPHTTPKVESAMLSEPDTSMDEMSPGSSGSCSRSFAQMLKGGEVHQFKHVMRMKPQEMTSLFPQNSNLESQEMNSDDPDYIPPPTYKSSFGDALSEALSKVDVTTPDTTVGTKKNKRGKKKKKQTLLFSTSTQLQHL